jgi:hypothetical protein
VTGFLICEDCWKEEAGKPCSPKCHPHLSSGVGPAFYSGGDKTPHQACAIQLDVIKDDAFHFVTTEHILFGGGRRLFSPQADTCVQSSVKSGSELHDTRARISHHTGTERVASVLSTCAGRHSLCRSCQGEEDGDSGAAIILSIVEAIAPVNLCLSERHSEGVMFM